MVIALGDYMSVQCLSCIGGTRVRDDQARLEDGVHVVVGTPGRVFDMINRQSLGKYTKNLLAAFKCAQSTIMSFMFHIFRHTVYQTICSG